MEKFSAIKMRMSVVRSLCIIPLLIFPHVYFSNFVDIIVLNEKVIITGLLFNIAGFFGCFILSLGYTKVSQISITCINILVFLFWSSLTVITVGFGDLIYTEIKGLTHLCLIYLFATIPTGIVDYLLTVKEFKMCLNKISGSDSFMEWMSDAEPLIPEFEEYDMKLCIQQRWYVDELGSNYVILRNSRFRDQTRKINSIYQFGKFYTSRNYYSGEHVIRQCENLLKQVKEVYTDNFYIKEE
jgi:hypothetical protein